MQTMPIDTSAIRRLRRAAPLRAAHRPQREARQRKTRSAGAARALACFLAAADCVAAVTGVPAAAIRGKVRAGQGRERRLRFARQAALYLTVTRFDVPAAVLARALDRPKWRVSSACQRAEEARDEPAIEALFNRMEAML